MKLVREYMATCAAILLAAPVAAQHTAHAHERGTASPELTQQMEQVRQATLRYRDHATAVADGFERFGAEGPLMGEHWYHPDRVRQPLDLDRPSTLQYARIDGRRELVGVAYTVYRRPGEPMPEGFAGDDDHWHVHDVVRIARTLTAERPVARWLVERGVRRGRVGGRDGRTHLTMVHAWIWSDNPDGAFAQQHRALPYLRAGLPAEYAASGDDDAAWGVSLLSGETCPWEVRRVNALAGLSSSQRSRIEEACGRAEGVVGGAFRPDVGSATLNRAAADAWREYVAARNAVLAPDQLERLNVGIEQHMH